MKSNTLDDCLQHYQKTSPYEQSYVMMKQAMAANPKLFIDASLFKALRNQLCTIVRLEKNHAEWSYLGTIGRMFTMRLDTTDQGLAWIMAGGIFILRTDQFKTFSREIENLGGKLVDILEVKDAGATSH